MLVSACGQGHQRQYTRGEKNIRFIFLIVCNIYSKLQLKC